MKTTNTLTGLLLGALAFSPLATLADDTTLPNYGEQRQQYMDKSKQDAKNVLRLIDLLEDNEDVQSVYANYDMDPQWLEELQS